MSVLARALLVVCLFFLLPFASASAQSLELDLKRNVLDNGVTVIVWERPSAGRIGTRIFYRVDVAAERPGTAGLTHMLEHHLFKGSDIAGAFDWEKERSIATRIEVLSRQITESIDSRQGHIIMGHVGIEGEPADQAALELMHHVLAGGGFFSRMMRVLRTDAGITAALYGEVEPGRGAPNPYLWRFSGRPETLARGVRLALAEIERMREQGVTPAEFEAARTAYLDGLIPASYETPHRTAERFAHRQVFGVYAYQSPQYLNYYAGDQTQAAAIRRLTIEDVNRAARAYLHPDRLIIAAGGPLDEIQASAAPDDRMLVDGEPR